MDVSNPGSKQEVELPLNNHDTHAFQSKSYVPLVLGYLLKLKALRCDHSLPLIRGPNPGHNLSRTDYLSFVFPGFIHCSVLIGCSSLS